MKKCEHLVVMVSFVILALAATAVPAAAFTYRYWQNTGSSWTDSFNWSPSGVPTTDDLAYVNGGVWAEITSTDTRCAFVFVGTDYTGYPSTSGYVEQTGATNQIDGALYLGDGSGFFGEYVMYNSGSRLCAGNEYIGHEGTGYFYQYEGENNVFLSGSYGGWLSIGQLSGTGTYDLYGGKVWAATTEQIGVGGTGTFNQHGGTNTVAGLSDVPCYLDIGSTGTYNLWSGEVSARGERIGNGGNFYHYSGSSAVTCNGLYVGYGGNYSSLTGNYYLQHDGYGHYGQLQATNEYIGYSGPDMFGATVSGKGYFQQSGYGTNNICDGDLYLGYNSGSTGTYSLSGGNLTASGEIIGVDGTGYFYQYYGTNVVTNNGLHIGCGPGPGGQYDLEGGTLEVSGVTNVGVGGNGYLNVVGFSQATFSTLNIGTESSGSGRVTWEEQYPDYNWNATLSADEINIGANGELDVYRSWDCDGTITMTGGRLALERWEEWPIWYNEETGEWGYEWVLAGNYGLTLYNGGTLNIGNDAHVDADLYIDAGGTVNYWGGDLNSNAISLCGQFNGYQDWQYQYAPGCYIGGGGVLDMTGYDMTLNGSSVWLASGSFTAANLSVGYGWFSQTGGTSNVDGELAVGVENAFGTSLYSIEGDSLSVGNLHIGPKGEFKIQHQPSVPLTVTVNGDFTIDNGGKFTADAGTIIHMTGSNFYNNSTSEVALAGLENATFVFEGGSDADTFEVAGLDLGAVMEGFDNNFTLYCLTLGGEDVAFLTLIDGYDNGNRGGEGGNAEALYVQWLTINPGCTLDLNGYHLYTLHYENDGGHVEGGKVSVIGEETAVPEPGTVFMMASAAVGFAGIAARRVRRMKA
jgi:hypothetical protein